MDYEVNFSELSAHVARITGLLGQARGALTGAELDAAASAMPGSMSAGVSQGLARNHQQNSTKYFSALQDYIDSADSCRASYEQQENDATDAIEGFFGGMK